MTDLPSMAWAFLVEALSQPHVVLFGAACCVVGWFIGWAMRQ